jgi:hypothetical protein
MQLDSFTYIKKIFLSGKQNARGPNDNDDNPLKFARIHHLFLGNQLTTISFQGFPFLNNNLLILSDGFAMIKLDEISSLSVVVNMSFLKRPLSSWPGRKLLEFGRGDSTAIDLPHFHNVIYDTMPIICLYPLTFEIFTHAARIQDPSIDQLFRRSLRKAVWIPDW